MSDLECRQFSKSLEPTLTVELIDTREMLAIHECLRKEIAALPIRVKAVPDGDTARAAIVGNHILLLAEILHSHHQAEDQLLWPLLRERATDQLALIDSMQTQHDSLDEKLRPVESECSTWMSDPSATNRAGLHTRLIALERVMLEHLSVEESEVLPLVASHLTDDEFGAVGVHARASLDPQKLAIGLGMILDANTPEIGEVVLGAMPPEARAGFEQFGRPGYAAYRSALLA